MELPIVITVSQTVKQSTKGVPNHGREVWLRGTRDCEEGRDRSLHHCCYFSRGKYVLALAVGRPYVETMVLKFSDGG